MNRRRFLKDAAQAGMGLGVSAPLLGKETSSQRAATPVVSLNGEWVIATDPENVGREEKWWTNPRKEAQKTKVPWIIQDAFPAYHGVAWYWRDFTALAHRLRQGRYLLRFDAVDYLADVWVNGIHVGGHEGSCVRHAIVISHSAAS